MISWEGADILVPQLGYYTTIVAHHKQFVKSQSTF